MRMFLDGEWVERDATRDVVDPADGSLIDTVPEATAADMTTAIDAARTAFAVNHPLPAHRRIEILREAAEHIAGRHEEFSQTIAREGIKTIREARKEVTRCVETLRVSSEEARRITGETVPFDQSPGAENRFGFYTRVPVGIVGAITPFNDPLNLVAHKVGPAIAAGNAVIVKPHEETPLSALRLAEAFEAARLPKGLLQVITGAGAVVGDALVIDPRVRTLSFSGGRETGEKILARAGMKKIGMELGSIAPVIVMADADLDQAVASNVSGAYWAAGQNCLHVQRLLVHQDIYVDFVERFVAAAEAYTVGDKLDEATDMGPLITEDVARRVEAWVQEAVESGARLLTGGTRNGSFFSPTLLDRVPDDCSVAAREVFGPVTVVWPFGELDEALEKANEVDFGLQGAIFTTDLGTAFRAVDGLGREGVKFALEKMTEIKLACFNL
jgi:glyceraldehyde-3-phosphate dehydrogenase (NADP+)